MKKLFCFVLAAMLLLSLCAPVSAEVLANSGGYDYTRFKGQDITIKVCNWGEYIADGSDDTRDVISEFEELTGIDVEYFTFASNEELYTKMKPGGYFYDVIVPSEYMVARMAAEDMLAPLDLSNIPNLALIDDEYKDMSYDPGNTYSVPYMWGLVGLVYNTDMVEDEITSWSALWDQKYMGNILMFNNSRDAFGIALLELGYSLNSTDPDEIAEAAQLLKDQKYLVQAYVMDEIFNKMEGGEAAIAPYYAGDAITMIYECPNLAFAIPEEGTNYFVDSFVIPKECAQKEAAEMFINFMCEPEISAANAEYIGYSTPISAARDMLDMEDWAYEIAYPSEEVIENTEVFENLPADINALIAQYWTDIFAHYEGTNKWVMPVFLAVAFSASVAITVYRARKRAKTKY